MIKDLKGEGSIGGARVPVHADPGVDGTAGHDEPEVERAGMVADPRPGGEPALLQRQRQEPLGVDVALHVDVVVQRHLPGGEKRERVKLAGNKFFGIHPDLGVYVNPDPESGTRIQIFKSRFLIASKYARTDIRKESFAIRVVDLEQAAR
jgi:hypothetical protein